MKKIPTNNRIYFVSILMLTLTACSGGGSGGGGGTTNTSYPNSSNASNFPTKIDTLEGTLGGDNTPATATSTTVGATSYHTIYPLEDVDWIKIDLNSAVQYEFSVDNVSYNGLPVIDLFESDGTTPVTYGISDVSSGKYGYFAFNPRVTFTPTVSGTYYARVSDSGGGVNSYTFSTRVFTGADLDADTYSTYYDCDDSNADIYPWALDTLGHTVDQSCSDYIWPEPTSDDFVDVGVGDGDFSTAGSLPIVGGDPDDIIHRQDIYSKTHTITAGDTDFYKITVPAHTWYDILDIENTGTALESNLYDSSQNMVDFTSSGNAIYYTGLINNTDNPVDYYLEVYATDNTQAATYVLAIGDWGTDADLDGRWTRTQGPSWDCNDNDDTIYGGATETPGDGIDSNCNGKDDS